MIKYGKLRPVAGCFALCFAAFFCAGAVAQEDDDEQPRAVMLRSTHQQLHLASQAMVRLDLEGMQKAKEDTQSEIEALNGEGPSSQWVDLRNELEFSNLREFGLDPQELCGYSMLIYPDLAADGIFYYYPYRYFIKRDEQSRYLLHFDYKAESESDDKNVVISVRLTPGSETGDFKVLEEFARAYMRNLGRSDANVRLLPMPADYNPSFEMGHYGVSNNDVKLTGIDRATGELGMTLETTVETRQMLVNQLSNQLGIMGNVVLDPVTMSPEPDALDSYINVTATMQFCDSQAYSRTPWQRQRGSDYTEFRNDHPFPIVLRHLVYLRSTEEGVDVRGYALGNQQLAPGDVARIPNSMIDAEVDDEQTLAAWYEYSLDCDSEALRDVVSALTGGVGSVPISRVGVEVPNPSQVFEQLGVYKVIVAVRSRYWDVNSREELTQTFELTKESATVELPTFYLWDEGEVSERTLYVYRFGVITSDGEQFSAVDWRSPDVLFERTIVIGANQISELMSEEEDEPQD